MKEDRDVLMILQFFYPEYVTSSQLAFDTAKALTDAGMTVDVLCGYPSEYRKKDRKKGEPRIPSKETVEGIGIRRVKYITSSRKGALGRLVNYFSLSFSMSLRMFSLRNYRVILTYSQPPMVTPMVALAAKLFNLKVVFVAHDVYPEIAIATGNCREKGLMAGTMRKINAAFAKKLSAVVCLSPEMRDFFAEKRKINRKKLAVIPNWHRDLYRNEAESTGTLGEALPEKTTEKKPFVCSYLGNLGVCQDMDTPLSAIRLLEKDEKGRNIRFVFAGHGSELPRVEKETGDNPNVACCGYLTGEAYQRVLEESDCFLVTLKPGLGGLCAPSKVYSYMMMGKPVIAVCEDKAILSDLHRYGCGIAVANGDGEGLAESLKKLADYPELCKTMGQGARRCYLENYTKEKCCPKYAELVRELLKASSK